MRKWAFRFSWIALLLAHSTFAFAAETVTLKLMTAGSGPVMGGVYTSPYGVSIDGGPTTLMICDDFFTNVRLGQTWVATVSSLEDIQARVGAPPTTPQTPKFTTGSPTGTITDADVAKYATAGVLASQLMALVGSSLPADGITRGELSYAIWGVFEPGLLASNPPSGTGHLTATQLASAQKFLSDAQAVVAAATTGGVVDLSKLPFASMTIYTPDPLKASQEFILVTMAEPPYPVVLAFDLLAVAGVIAICRRRLGLLS
jgi:hypothetical protein